MRGGYFGESHAQVAAFHLDILYEAKNIASRVPYIYIIAGVIDEVVIGILAAACQYVALRLAGLGVGQLQKHVLERFALSGRNVHRELVYALRDGLQVEVLPNVGLHVERQ